VSDLVDRAGDECEFCGERHVVMILADHPRVIFEERGMREGDVYAACPNCLLMLVTHSLSPQQYLRAQQAGRDMDRHYLHYDYYDRDGTALQAVLPQVAPSDRLATHLAAGGCALPWPHRRDHEGRAQPITERRCQVCGCTDTNACWDPVRKHPCYWAKDDLCSACVGVYAGVVVAEARAGHERRA